MSSIRKIPINTPGAGGETSPGQDTPASPRGQGSSFGQGSSEHGKSMDPQRGSKQPGPTHSASYAQNGPAAHAPLGGENAPENAAGKPQDKASEYQGKAARAAGRTHGGHSRSAGPSHEPGTRGPDHPAAGVPNEEGEAAESMAPSGAMTATELEALASERDALNDALLRLRAEFENYRRRSAREMAESRERAQAELLNDLLPVLDNLERALDAAEHHDETKVLGGVRMTRDMFVDLLRRTGVEEVETEGAPFDPAVHEAIVMQPSKEHAEGSVSAVLQRGYRQGDHILRPARVVVSSGPGESDDGREAE